MKPGKIKRPRLGMVLLIIIILMMLCSLVLTRSRLAPRSIDPLFRSEVHQIYLDFEPGRSLNSPVDCSLLFSWKAQSRIKIEIPTRSS